MAAVGVGVGYFGFSAVDAGVDAVPGGYEGREGGDTEDVARWEKSILYELRWSRRLRQRFERVPIFFGYSEGERHGQLSQIQREYRT